LAVLLFVAFTLPLPMAASSRWCAQNVFAAQGDEGDHDNPAQTQQQTKKKKKRKKTNSVQKNAEQQHLEKKETAKRSTAKKVPARMSRKMKQHQQEDLGDPAAPN